MVKTGEYDTAVYHKPTDAGKCMNGNGERSHNYELSVIRAYVRRALKVCFLKAKSEQRAKVSTPDVGE